MSTLPPQALLGCIHTLWSWADLAYTEHTSRVAASTSITFAFRSARWFSAHKTRTTRLHARRGPLVAPTNKSKRSSATFARVPAQLGRCATQRPRPLNVRRLKYRTSKRASNLSAALRVAHSLLCLPARHSLYGWLLLSARFGRGHILPAGKYECQYEPHVGGGVRHMPCGTLLRGWLADQLRKVDLQPAGGSGYADGVQVVPPKLCDQGNRRRFGS